MTRTNPHTTQMLGEILEACGLPLVLSELEILAKDAGIITAEQTLRVLIKDDRAQLIQMIDQIESAASDLRLLLAEIP